MAMKSAETLAFLRLNPAYMIRNVVNNEVTMLARGLIGRVTLGDAENLIKRIGFEPTRMAQGFGAIGEATIGSMVKHAEVGSTAIQEALRGERGFLDKAQDFFSNIKPGKLDMGNISAQFEKGASRRAFTLGYMQGMRRYFWKPGRGFDSARQYFRPEIIEAAEAANPGIMRGLERAIGSALNDAEIDAAVRGNLNISVNNILEDASRRTGFNVGEVLGDYIPTFEKGLNEAAQNGTVRQFMAGVRADLQSHLDEKAKTLVDDMARRVETKVIAEGPQAVYKVWGDISDEWTGAMTYHAMNMEVVASYAQSIIDPQIAHDAWKNIKLSNSKYWERSFERMDAYVSRIKKGAAKLPQPINIPDEVYDSFKELRKGWKEFHTLKNAEQDAFFDALLKGKEPPKPWAIMQAEHDARYAAMIEVEDRLTRRMDELIGNLIPDAKQRDLYTIWRKNAADLRLADKEAVVAFRETIKGKSPEARMQAFQKHWQERIKRMGDMKRENKDGLAMMQGEPRAVAFYRGQADVAELRRIAQVNGIPTVDEAGNIISGSDTHIKNAINKYLPEGNPKYERVEDIPLPVAQEAFRARATAEGIPTPRIFEGKRAWEMSDDELRQFINTPDEASIVPDATQSFLDFPKSGKEILDDHAKYGMVGAERKWAIESALRNNESVPADELAKYPELAEIYPSAKIAPVAAEAAPAAAPKKVLWSDLRSQGFKPGNYAKVRLRDGTEHSLNPLFPTVVEGEVLLEDGSMAELSLITHFKNIGEEWKPFTRIVAEAAEAAPPPSVAVKISEEIDRTIVDNAISKLPPKIKQNLGFIDDVRLGGVPEGEEGKFIVTKMDKGIIRLEKVEEKIINHEIMHGWTVSSRDEKFFSEYARIKFSAKTSSEYLENIARTGGKAPPNLPFQENLARDLERYIYNREELGDDL